MMKLICVGSGSSGNTWILESEKDALILDCGMPFLEVKKALNFNVSKISGCLVTHHHQDHYKYAKEYVKAGFPVIAPFEKGNTKLRNNSQFKVQPFELNDCDGNPVHSNGDGSPCQCFGYYIKHPDMGKMLYITDAYMVKQNFSKVGVNHILIGTNYDENLVDDADGKSFHVWTGHLSIQYLINTFLPINKTDELRTLILCHLSSFNADTQSFKASAEKVVDCPVYVANKGIQIELKGE